MNRIKQIFTIKATFVGVALFALASLLLAAEEEKKAIAEKQKKIAEIKLAVIEAKAKADSTMQELSAQRVTLQQKIKAARKDFQNSQNTLNKAAKTTFDNLNELIKTFRSKSKTYTERMASDKDIADAKHDENDLKETLATLDQVRQPNEISD